MSSDPFDLARFIRAQDADGTYDQAVAELRDGAKRSHWMWFVFPQISGLGTSDTSVRFAVSGLAEARAYLAHPVLGPRLHECARIVLDHDRIDANSMLGPVDAAKLCSSMTLFAYAATDPQDFRAVLRRFFGGREDHATTARLGSPDLLPEDAEED